MKFKTMRQSIVSGVIAVLTMTAAHAQDAIAITVPFDYFAGGKVLPAGEYKIQTSGIANGVVLLRNLEQGVSAMMIGNPLGSTKPSQDARLVFHRYGDSYFLSEIWANPGSTRGLELRRSSAEREQIAKLGPATTVGLTARR